MLSAINKVIPSLFANADIDELHQLQKDIGVKTEETPVDALIARIDALSNEYNLMERGEDWKGRQSSDAVRAIEYLDFSSIMKDILSKKGISFSRSKTQSVKYHRQYFVNVFTSTKKCR